VDDLFGEQGEDFLVPDAADRVHKP
jgi:hypothetical protein